MRYVLFVATTTPRARRWRPPFLEGPRYLDWPVPDPAGEDIETVRAIRHEIADHVLDLLKELLP